MTPLPSRRSCLTVPGASDKMMSKALTLDADEIVLDLEDAVPSAAKTEARARVAAAIATPAWRARTTSVRVNALATPWGKEDIEAIAAAAGPHLTLIIPKVESPADIAAVAAAAPGLALQALIETAAGLAGVYAIAGASSQLQSLIIGYADLAASLGRPPSAASWQTVQDMIVIAARAHGLQPIDGPFFRIDASDALRSECRRAADQGFEGKWAIHPSQVPVVNAAFTPAEHEVAAARALLAELDRTKGAASAFAGGMIDEAMRAAAWRTLARAGLSE